MTTKDDQNQIKRTNDLEDIFSQYTSNDLEIKNEIDVSSNNLKKVIEGYGKFLEHNLTTSSSFQTDLYLEPSEFMVFPSLIKKYKDHFRYPQSSFYINSLIKNSYDRGNTKFYFTFDETMDFSHFLFNVKVPKENPLRIKIKGNVSSFSFGNSANIITLVEGDVKSHFGYQSNDLICKIIGDTGPSFGTSSIYMKAEINGSVGSNFGRESIGGNFLIHSDVNKSIGAEAFASTFFIDGYFTGTNRTGRSRASIVTRNNFEKHMGYHRLLDLIEKETKW